MDDPRTFDRHIDTLAALNVVAAAMFAGLAAWLVGGLHASVNREERKLRLWLAAACVLVAALFGLLWLGLQLRWRGGSIAQLAAGIVMLPLVPVGTAWGWYVLWVLTKRGARDRFARGATPPVGVRPFPGVVALAALLGALAIAIVPVKAREAWLSAQDAELSRTAAARGETISDQATRLRAAGLIDGEGADRHGSK